MSSCVTMPSEGVCWILSVCDRTACSYETKSLAWVADCLPRWCVLRTKAFWDSCEGPFFSATILNTSDPFPKAYDTKADASSVDRIIGHEEPIDFAWLEFGATAGNAC